MRCLLLAAALIAVCVHAEHKGLSYCCEALRASGLQGGIISSDAAAYATQEQKYFSATAQLRPQCFFRPTDASEVSRAVKALVTANETEPCHFAVRGAGHTSFAGAAGIEDGVTIDMGLIAEIEYYEGNNSVSIGAGAVWGDVYKLLDKFDVAVTGARSSTVGVGGFVIGGGNSYHAARKGWVCDNVLRFELVLADGSIVIASKDERPYLYQALKGGSSNFGIVTRYDVQTFKGGDFFGGVVTYPGSTAKQQLEAFHEFVDKIEEDPYGSVIVISTIFSKDKTPGFMNAYEYTKVGTKALPLQTFGKFLAIPGNMSDSTALRNMTSIAEEFEAPTGARVSFSTFNSKNDMRVLTKANEVAQQVNDKLSAEATGDWSFYLLYQPIPTIFSKNSEERGGNVLGLEHFKENLIMYEPYLKWSSAEQDELFESQAVFLRDEITSFAASIGADNPWVYLNYADRDQNPLEGYGSESLAKIRAVAEQYDPEGVFQYMMPGGFKISRVDIHAEADDGLPANAGKTSAPPAYKDPDLDGVCPNRNSPRCLCIPA